MIACSACRATSSRARPRVFEVSWCGPTNKERPRHLSFHSHTGGFHRRCKKPPTHSHAAEAQPFDSRRTREQYCGRRSHSSLTPRSPVASPSWPRSSRRPARSSSRRDVRRRMARDCSSSKGITIFRRWILFRANKFCCIVTNAYFYFRYTTLVKVKRRTLGKPGSATQLYEQDLDAQGQAWKPCAGTPCQFRRIGRSRNR